jgi:hypothetical protein
MREMQELPAQASKKNSSVKWKSTKKNRVLKLAGEVDSNNLSENFLSKWRHTTRQAREHVEACADIGSKAQPQ